VSKSRSKGPRPILSLPGFWADQVEAASERDRAYFEQHPGCEMYVRCRLPGEFGPYEGTPMVERATHVEVVQIEPGVRQRSPVALLRGCDYPSGRIPFEHVEALAEVVGGDLRSLRVYENDEIED
jgi:hypothetical protein